MSVNYVSHPLVATKLSELRDQRTPSSRFRGLVKEISTLLAIEASRDLQLKDVPNLQSPVAPYTGQELAHRIGVSPILRAGIGMTEALLDLFPAASVHYLGLYRERVSLQPVEYYQKLPATPNVDTLYLLDPLIATGGTAIAAISMLLDWGLDIKNIKLLSILGSKPGLSKIADAYPELEIYVGGIDEVLSEQGLVVPGLGDSGDRLFATLV
ncbi:uracil phosphoribosyltransferase [Sporobolomyces koalae]|uniref:uracil phosphoribosyltransferase n=1 Tax=Sporobolomyces koalae TaxID=500713 RepID=UPI00316EA809